MFEVTYNVKDAAGYIKEHKAKFMYLQDAMRFIRALNNGTLTTSRVLGKPSIERV
jgi:hypothetical protein